MYYTPVTLYPLTKKINLQDKIITAGSCFADAIGQRFEDHKFKALVNPFGTVYNPVSLNRQFNIAIGKSPLEEDKILHHQDLFFHYDFHSIYVNNTRESLHKSIEEQIRYVHDFLKDAEWLVITWGTAFVYEINNRIVANCHKQAQRNFSKKLLSDTEIVDDLKKFIINLRELNPHLKIMVTISPVRHIRDTLPMNMVSKSVLRIAAQKASEAIDDLFYFPSYEIMMDELRDYRFYKEDMIHPTSQAEDYIWNSVKKTCMDEETQVFLHDWQEIRKALMHKAFNPLSDAHQAFLKKTLRRLDQLKDIVDVSREVDSVKRQILQHD